VSFINNEEIIATGIGCLLSRWKRLPERAKRPLTLEEID
jgi:hypothetical protein